MSRFYPHTPFAEDQPLPKTILTVHVLTRGFQTGALIGLFAGSARYAFSSTYRTLPSALSTKLLRSAGFGGAVGTALLSVGLAARMYGKESIEWSDRSWRLLENQGQVEVDDWSLGGAVAGLVGTTASGMRGWRPVLGGVGVGSLAGVTGYMIWKYGVNGAKKVEEEKKNP